MNQSRHSRQPGAARAIAPRRVLMSLMAILALLTLPVYGLEGEIGIHDPATIMYSNGKYYTYGTGATALTSEDGWTWTRGVTPGRTGMAPDAIKLGDKYFLYVSANVGGQPHAEVNLVWTKSLDPTSPDYEWHDEGLISRTNGEEFANGIDPGMFLDPNTGKLWMIYGSYFGYLKLVELDPETGKRIDLEDTPYNVAINCEASVIIYRDGWYYILATHGSCCRGTSSGYNIRVGRSKNVTGPYLDHTGLDMMLGGGKLFLGSSGGKVGAGHFGLIEEGEGVQKFSIHWEADLEYAGRSVLDILPLKWENGWPVAGEYFEEGTYQLESVQTGTALELAVEGQPVGGGGRGMGGFGRGNQGPAEAIPAQDVNEVSANWPEGEVDVRLSNYMCQAQQKWDIIPAEGYGGYLGAPYFKIQISGTSRVLAATEDAELVALPEFTGSPEQLWRIEMLTDGTWRIMPKQIPGLDEQMVLTAIGSSFPTLSKFEPDSYMQRWYIKKP